MKWRWYHTVSSRVFMCVCDPDPMSLPVQLNENPADLVPPELPPKGIRRRQTPSKVGQMIKKSQCASTQPAGISGKYPQMTEIVLK